MRTLAPPLPGIGGLATRSECSRTTEEYIPAKFEVQSCCGSRYKRLNVQFSHPTTITYYCHYSDLVES